MAVAITGTTTTYNVPSGGTHTHSLTRAAGEGLYLVVFFQYEWAAANSITSVVWDAAGDNQAFTHVQTQGHNDGAGNRRFVATYYLAAPTSAKTADVVITFSGTINDQCRSVIRRVTGHDTAAMVRASAKRSESDVVANGLPITVASQAGDLVLAAGCVRDLDIRVDAGDAANYHEVSVISPGNGSTVFSGTKAGAASVTTTFAFTGPTNYHNALISASIAPAAADTTAPILTTPTGTQTGSTTANVGATTDEGNGTMWAVVTTSATQPSVAQIKAGQDHTGAAAAWGGSQAISTTGAKTLGASGLTASTTYYGHVIHTDAAANDSNIVTSASFTTTAGGGSSNAPRAHYYQMMRNA